MDYINTLGFCYDRGNAPPWLGIEELGGSLGDEAAQRTPKPLLKS